MELEPWSPNHIISTIPFPFCQLNKKVVLRLSEHSEVIETQSIKFCPPKNRSVIVDNLKRSPPFYTILANPNSEVTLALRFLPWWPTSIYPIAWMKSMPKCFALKYHSSANKHTFSVFKRQSTESKNQKTAKVQKFQAAICAASFVIPHSVTHYFQKLLKQYSHRLDVTGILFWKKTNFAKKLHL